MGCGFKEGVMRLARWTPLVFVLSACSTVHFGQDFDLLTFESRVQRGVTTKTDVTAWLGPPSSTGQSVETSGERYEEWTYYQGEGRLPSMADARLKILQIKFDQEGVVRGYNWSGERR
jgi:hypothetical protein